MSAPAKRSVQRAVDDVARKLTDREVTEVVQAMNQRPDPQDRAHFRAAKRRADAARNFPTQTDPCSRHLYIMADCLMKKGGYPMLTEEPGHCAISIMATVAALWEARAKLAKAVSGKPHVAPETD